MINPWQVRRFAENQLDNLRRLMTGRQVTFPSLGSMTLEHDDVRVARQWLRDRRGWNDKNVVEKFEQEFAHWNGSRQAYAFMSGRAALSACIHTLALSPNDEVILPGYTCIVVRNAFHFAGVNTVYCDIELDSYGLDVSSVENAITPKTRAILIQHLYGLVSRDYCALLELAERHGFAIIEDCSHATGAEFRNVKVGNRGTVGFYSSEQSKIFNTIQGGIAVTNDDALGRRLHDFWEHAPDPNTEFIDKLLHNVLLNFYGQKHSQRWWLSDFTDLLYGHKSLISTTQEEIQGRRPNHYGARMSAPIAALGLNQLRKIDRYNAIRRETARQWKEWCCASGYTPPKVIRHSTPVFLRYPVMVTPERKADLAWAERELGVKLGNWFTGSFHPMSYTLPNCPNAEIAVASCINLPTILQ